MRTGGDSKEVVLPMSEGGEVSLPEVTQRPGEQDPIREGAVLEKILFILER
jgi:hypothetical protein